MEELRTLYDSLGMGDVNWELILRVSLQVVLLGFSAVFSGSETALFSLSRIDLQKLRHSRDKHSENIHAMLDEPRRLIISILCGNELVNIASAANMAAILLLLFGEQDVGWFNILIMVPLLLLIGEVTPKTIAVSFPVKFATRLTARILPRWIVLITPLREVVRQISDRITTLVVGEAVSRENILHADELRTLLEESEESGVIEATERVLIDNVIEASETDISRIMTPGPRIRFLDADLPVTELIDKFREYQHPRIPVYQGHWDNVIGFIHSEDILRLIQGGGDLEQVTLEMIIKPAHFVPPTKKVDEMFDYFQAHNTRVAIVLGEYGEVLGIVTMKDVLTFIFGEISGKMVGLEYYQEEDDNSYVVPGDMRLSDFYNLTNFDIEDPVMSTIAGVAFRLFDCLPKEGDKVRYEGYEFIAREVTGLRISKIQVRKIVANEERTEESSDDQSESDEADDESLNSLDESTELEPDGDTSGQDADSAADKKRPLTKEVQDELER
ncbi:MAG: hemolysin family protein [Candidatus Thiodiazotropha lotti]|nr:hemolysin family protein [Candidatus Thiodiazotropha endoloripes]MCG7899218.1 hemolysin family protein [Candidatus Thiodiazotropha weberae]MCG7991319.1 hemolysin family protein [Candidatus Thiodiazotropha lotti]MCG7998345.1 hemolysin family protein [Candidatus Thiodiazotropha lotti]MCW4182974.1 hemolysin family protein [Candidatus Thiodiazotropha weberae]MCW4190111.1 hemolysin family protein [Candidatus Thiodiazotropha weberae]